MRNHGDPNRADPSIDVHKVIWITWNPAIPGGLPASSLPSVGEVRAGDRPSSISAEVVSKGFRRRAPGAWSAYP